jgi:hypothetical protein
LNSVAKDRLVDLLGQEEVQHDPDLHRHITNALGTKTGLSFLRSELTKENSVVRHRNLLNALALVGPETLPQFIEVLMASSEELATNALEILQQNSLWHNEKAQDEVMKLLKELVSNVSNQNYLYSKRLVRVLAKIRFKPLISIFCEMGNAQLRAFIEEEFLNFILTSPHGREIPSKIIVEDVAKEMRRWEEGFNVERFARAASFMKALSEYGIKDLRSQADTVRSKVYEKEIATALISFGPSVVDQLIQWLQFPTKTRVAVVQAVFAAFPDNARTALEARIQELKKEQFIADKDELARCATVLAALPPKRV